MSNPNKIEINKQYGEMVKTVSNVNDNTAHCTTGLTFNEVASTSMNTDHICTNKTTVTDNNFKLINIDTQSNSNFRQYDRDIFNNIESLYPQVINCRPQYLSVEMKKEVIIAMNATTKIKDIEIIVPNKVVKVTFEDDRFEKAVCHEDDEFNLETAIGICITKYLCGGTSTYNKLIRNGVKLYNEKCKAEEEAKIEQKRIEEKRKKRYEKKIARKKRIEEEKRQARINEQAEAIKLAHKMIGSKSKLCGLLSKSSLLKNKEI